MRFKTAGVAALGAVVLASSAGPAPLTAGPVGAPSGVQSPEPSPPAPRIEDEVTRYVAASRPGAEHQWLEPLAGTWKMDATWNSATRQPMHAAGTSENRWILGGRFLLCELAAGDGASRIEGTTIYGFDSRQRRFLGLAFSNLSTSYLQTQGTYDPVDHSFILSGKERDEMTGGVVVYRFLLKSEGPDRYSLRAFFDVPGGPPLKVFEAVFTRP